MHYFRPDGENASMQDFATTLGNAIGLILLGDADLIEIIALSLRVTLSAVVIACLIGLPLGALVGAFRFPGRTAVTILLNALMGLPPSSSAWLSI
jgi:tungstate transport system permease protein